MDWNKEVKEILDRTEFMALSTLGDDGVWTNPVQFSYDNKLGLYSKSMPNSKHMQNMLKNREISVAIFSTNRLSDGGVAGLQIKGTAEILHNREEVTEAAKYHYTRNRPGTDYMNRVEEHLGEEAVWNFFKITPTEVWVFDTRYFDEEKDGRQQVPLDILDLSL